MKAILIPVKERAQAKQRLAAHLSPTARAALAEAMLEDFFAVIAAARGFDRVFVVSTEPQALERARVLGWETILEPRQISESDSVDFASRWCARKGITALLRLPIDLPLVQPRDIESLFEEIPAAPAALLVPSRDGTGTNALLRTPPNLFSSHFGPGSFALHREEAAKRGATFRIVRNPRLEFDVDDWGDLQALCLCPPQGTATAAWLKEYGSFLREDRCASREPQEASVSTVVNRGAASR